MNTDENLHNQEKITFAPLFYNNLPVVIDNDMDRYIMTAVRSTHDCHIFKELLYKIVNKPLPASPRPVFSPNISLVDEPIDYISGAEVVGHNQYYKMHISSYNMLVHSDSKCLAKPFIDAPTGPKAIGNGLNHK